MGKKYTCKHKYNNKKLKKNFEASLGLYSDRHRNVRPILALGWVKAFTLAVIATADLISEINCRKCWVYRIFF